MAADEPRDRGTREGETGSDADAAIAAVVPCFRADAYIGRCLDGLLDAGFRTGEIVVVVDGAEEADATVTLDECRRRGIAPRVLQKNVGAAGSRNAGAEASAASILFFVDADVVVHADVRRRVIAFFDDHPDHAAVFGAYDDRPAHPDRVSRIRNLLHRHVHRQGAGEAVTFWTGCGAVRRADFEAVGGFDPGQAMMEDVKLGMALAARGRRIRLDPAIQGTHLKRWSLRAMARTDLLYRAIPWARLMRGPEGKALPETLNVGAAGKASVLSVAASLLGVAALVAAPVVGIVLLAASLATLILANRAFLADLAQNHAALDAVVAVPVLWVHYLCGGLGYAWVRLNG